MLNADKKREVEKLLPWYVNGTLSQEEKKQVELALAEDKSLRNELEYLTKLRISVKNNIVSSPGEFGIRRLKDKMERKQKTRSSERDTKKQWWQPSLAVAAALLILVQSGVLINMWDKTDDPRYQPLGTVEEGVIVQVSFVPNATEAEIRQVLSDIGGEFVSGPGTIGVYRIRLNLSDEDTAAIAGTIDRLKSFTNVVRYAAQQ
jgi:anti-sigma-K factor RskA